MQIIKVNNGVPETYSLSQLKVDLPNVSFRRGYPASQLNPLGIYYVTDTAQPVFNNMIETISEGTPVKVVDDWVQVWDVTPLSQTEIDARAEQKADQDDAAAIKLDAAVKALILARPAQIENYINTNVKTLATAKTVLIILAKAISALGKTGFR